MVSEINSSSMNFEEDEELKMLDFMEIDQKEASQ